MRKNVYAILLGICTVFALSACNALDLTPESKSNDSAAGAEEYPADVGNGEESTNAQNPTSGPAPTATVAAGPLVKAVKGAAGTIVTTAKDLPLYRFDQDAPGKTTCYNACAKKFTAYPWSEELAVEGIDKKYVGKVQRTDGTWQLTLNKWPVYTIVADAPGEAKAHGANGWWLIAPDGKKLPAAKQG
jgi:predicted lipoprotein with Yx(FWY)xxD motif